MCASAERFQSIMRGYGIKISEQQDATDKIGPEASMKWLNLTSTVRPGARTVVLGIVHNT